jgi:PKD repeat protein
VKVSHIYNVAGTYTATLTVSSADNVKTSSQVTIVVSGSGEGPVTGDTNFRWAPVSSLFKLNHARPASDSMNLSATFNSVDLPNSLAGLAATFTINNTFSITGIMGEEGGFVSPDNSRPEFFLQLDVKEQTLVVFISRADLKPAYLVGGAGNTTVPAPGTLVPVTYTLTVGAQTYEITELFRYVSTAGGKGQGEYNVKRNRGAIADGFFAIQRASAVENEFGTGHFFEFEGSISRPAALAITNPRAGNFIFRFNDADPVFVPFDRIRLNGSKVAYEQSDRDLGGVKSLVIDNITRRITIRTWDLLARTAQGGTGLPIRGDAFTAFNFTVRLDFDQPDGTTFQAVTATRMTRRSQDDAFWQTGRRRKRQ